jgi:hypothetical protein
VGRLVAVLLAIVAVAHPAFAEETPDCSVWSVRGIRPGMTQQEAQAGHPQWEKGSHAKDPPGYIRFKWQARNRPEKIDLHVDTNASPPRVIGVGATVPNSVTPGKEFLAGLIEKWGEPISVSKQGAFNLYAWSSAECDVDVRVSVMNVEHQVGVFMAMGSISGRWEYVQRQRAAKEEAASAQPEGGGAADATAPEGTAPETAAEGDGP